ncbi:hypothetical protein M378DRAFT_163821 [Amanita muscaria Koide BX008]|uniref:Uncharacterized protein n=1 Tax=Amanita muscaria (strain Koide BX008) TaxID=946122 RepID=A0A0C2TAY8_AMAMK|nr:hypothetical protein M378DRAFT_163821 [Amanita muscaria Koide BX008]
MLRATCSGLKWDPISSYPISHVIEAQEIGVRLNACDILSVGNWVRRSDNVRPKSFFENRSWTHQVNDTSRQEE